MNTTEPVPPTTKMPEVERGMLITYDVTCTALTLLFNTAVIFLILSGVSIQGKWKVAFISEA